MAKEISKNGFVCKYTHSKREHFQSTSTRKGPYYFEGKKKLKEDYGAWDEYWGHLKRLPDFFENGGPIIINKLFGDIISSDFSNNHIVELPLTHLQSYKALGYSIPINSTFKIKGNWIFTAKRGVITINSAISKSVLAVFSNIFEIAKTINYKITSIHAYIYRYKAQYGGEPALKNDIENGKNIDFNKLSNHSIGTAIDINPSQNWLGDTLWDIPEEFVKCFRSHGFFWGGEYSTSKDAMHFEYKLPHVDLSNISFPFSSPSIEASPLKYYFLNESGAEGLFPCGSNQNIHGGIHLAPAAPGDEIRGVLPGYIVAARLVGEGKAGDNEQLKKFVGATANFILIRHDLATLQQAATPGAEPAEIERFALYSFYMHLKAPVFADDADKYRSIKWVKKLVDNRYGAIVDLDPARATCGETLWATEAFAPAATNAKVRNSDGIIKEITTMVGDKRTAYAKAAPEDVAEIFTSLDNGEIVTFAQPYLIVDAGEVIGIADKEPLHWEMIARCLDIGWRNISFSRAH
jgi:hypothetical protein